MKINEKLFDRVKNIQEQMNKIYNLDLSNIVDLEKAKECVRVIKEDFTKMLEESPLYNKLIDIVSKLMDYDVKEDIEKWENIISDKIDELKNKSDDDCSDDCAIDEIEDDDIEVKLYDYPLSGKEIYEDWIFDDLHNSINLKDESTYLNLIASFMNENFGEFDRNEDEDTIELIANVLYEFINYTMNR